MDTIKKEELDDALKIWCRSNFDNLDDKLKAACLEKMREVIPQHVVEDWKANGYDYPLFHLTAGMSVRNLLREVALDTELPPVKYPSGDLVQNWDDYYTGAIDALLETL